MAEPTFAAPVRTQHVILNRSLTATMIATLRRADGVVVTEGSCGSGAAPVAELLTYGEAQLIDPYFDAGTFVFPFAPLGLRGERRAWLHAMARTHQPPLRISVTSADWLGIPDAFYVVVLEVLGG